MKNSLFCRRESDCLYIYQDECRGFSSGRVQVLAGVS